MHRHSFDYLFQRETVNPLKWVGPNRKGIQKLPKEARHHIGHVLNQMQVGILPQDAKPLGIIDLNSQNA